MTVAHSNQTVPTDFWSPFINKYDEINNFSFSAGPGGRGTNARKCPSAGTTHRFYYEMWQSNAQWLFGDKDEIILEVKYNRSGGKLSGHTVGTGQNASLIFSGRVAWVIISINGHFYEKEYYCECFSVVPCVSVSVGLQRWVDQLGPWNYLGTQLTANFDICAA